MSILIASSNRNKIAELTDAARANGFELLSPRDPALADRGMPPEVEETGTTYADNAILKGRAYAAWAAMTAIADDSGLEVECLNGRPGVLSARYGGSGISDRERCQLLLEEIEGCSDQAGRRAAFICSLVAVDSTGTALAKAEYRMPGIVLRESRGEGGFGYDPIIHIPELGATLAEIPFSRTCREGFRARAAEQLFRMLKR